MIPFPQSRAQASPSPDLNLTAALGLMEGAQLLRHVDDGTGDLAYLFKHALVQDTAYASLLKQDRQHLHRAVGRALEEMFPDRQNANASLLAQHFDAAGDAAKAVEYYGRAGDVASHVYANAEAIMHYSRALQLADAHSIIDPALVEHLYAQRGRTYELSGRYAEALENYDAMSGWAQQHNAASVELTALLARSILHATFTPIYNPERGSVLAEQALALARELGDRVAEAKALWNLELLGSFGRPQPERAIAYGEEGLALARRLNLREQMAFILNDLFYPYLQARTTTQTQAVIGEALALWQELDNQPMVTDALASSVLLYYLRGEFDQAIRLSEQGWDISKTIGTLWGQSYVLMYVGYVHWERGDPTRAISAMTESIRLAGQGGFKTPEIITRADLGLYYAELGAYEKGVELTKQAAAQAERELRIFGQWVVIAHARILVRMGELAAADAMMNQGPFNLSTTTSRYLHPQPVATLALLSAEYAIATTQYERAIAVLQDLLDDEQAHEVRAYTPGILYLQARACAAQGDPVQANTLLERATETAEAMGAGWRLWQILTLRGELAARNNAPARAAEHLARAETLFQAILLRTPEARRAAFQQTPAALALRDAQTAIVAHPEEPYAA